MEDGTIQGEVACLVVALAEMELVFAVLPCVLLRFPAVEGGLIQEDYLVAVLELACHCKCKVFPLC